MSKMLLLGRGLILAWLVTLSVAHSAENNTPHRDSERHDGVPVGQIHGPFDLNESTVFPGTHRQYWIYVPQQYDSTKPACSMIVQDGLSRAKGWKLPVVLDNLIHAGDMPVTIGIFVTPGVVPAPNERSQARYNRSFEYDGLGDSYSRFLLDELLPVVETKYNLSHDPNDRSVAGASSGGICAFTAAWERPDAFRRVLSTIGTYVNLRGGHVYPSLIRKTEAKPLRIFLQDGRTDLNIYAGSWWVANQDMLSALKFSGYDVQHAWGEGGHNSKHAAAIMPDALRWLWRDYPNPVTNVVGKKRRTDLLVEGQDWQLVSKGHKFTEGPAVDALGNVFFTDIPERKIFKISLDDSVELYTSDSGYAAGLMFGDRGELFATARNKILVFADGQPQTMFDGQPCNDLVVLGDSGYFTDPKNKKIWYVDNSGEKRVVDEGIDRPNGLVTSADQTLLHVADTTGKFTYCFQIQQDGSLKHKQRYGYLHTPDDAGASGADGMTVDTEGRLYVATHLGLQVLDQLGRVHFILPTPSEERMTNVVFGGAERDTIFVTVGGKVFKRKLNATGVTPNEGPVKPPKPGL